MSRKILIISYHFPPENIVGAERPAKFAKYLREFGWEPSILTIHEKYYEAKDPQKLADLGSLSIARTAVLPTPLDLALRLRNSLRRIGRRSQTWAAVPDAAGAPAASHAAAGAPARILQHLLRYVTSLTELPDKQIGWLIPAVLKAHAMVRRQGIRHVLTTAPPKSVSLIGALLAALTDVTLVTDLRDPWYLAEFKLPSSRSALSDLIETRLERWLLNRSALVLTTTEEYRDYLRRLYPSLPAQKLRVLPNGYDGIEFAKPVETAPGRRCVISYLGTFYLGRSPKGLLRAVRELMASDKLQAGEVELQFVGNVATLDGESLPQLIKDLGLESCASVHKPVPHARALELMRQSDILLLFAPDQYHCIPAKAYEYLGLRKRVLCLAKPGATASLVERSGCGRVVDQDDVPAIARALEALVEEHRRGAPIEWKIEVSQYERRTLTGQLAALLATL